MREPIDELEQSTLTGCGQLDCLSLNDRPTGAILFKYTLLFALFLLSVVWFKPSAFGQQLSLKVAGDKQSGYHVDIYNGDHLVVTNTEEFSLRLYNLDMSTVAEIKHWTGEAWRVGAWSGDSLTGGELKGELKGGELAGNARAGGELVGGELKGIELVGGELSGDSLKGGALADAEYCITLTRDSYIKEFDANLSVSVTYRVVNSNMVKKTVELFQPSMPGMYYIMQQTARPAEKPKRYVTFEYDDFPGGFVHEIFPAVGFITPDNHIVGFLTDAGYLNQYTRNTRRRFSGRGGGFVGMRRLPDVNLFTVADSSEREQNNHYIRQTFGEMYNLDAGTATVIKTADDYKVEGNAEVTYEQGLISITGHPGGRAGVELFAPFEDQRLYTISFWCKGNTPLALKLFRVKNGNKTIELEHGVKYIDNFPAIENEWTQFKGSILVPYIENDSVSMFIGTQSGKECWLQIKDLQFIEHHLDQKLYNNPINSDMNPLHKQPLNHSDTKPHNPYSHHHDILTEPYDSVAESHSPRPHHHHTDIDHHHADIEHHDILTKPYDSVAGYGNSITEPYNLLPLGEEITKTTYLFVEPWVSHQQFMISSQLRLAEGKGFRGTLVEKMLYANYNMHTWITDVKDFTPFNVPNMNYAPDMYNRDSFFATVATYNKALNLSIWEQWGKTQTPKGGVGTIITPYMGSVEAKDNEATIEWLIWAMLNKRRFDVMLPKEKIDKAVEYVLDEFDADRDGKCTSHFSLSQVDIVDFNPKTDRLGVNQGMLAIALRTIKELGYDISDAYIQKAEEEYRNFYDKERKHLLFDRNFPDIISLTDLEPEFYSLWLFNRPILTDEMIINHLDQMPVLNKVPNSPHPEFGITAPICVRLIKDAPGYSYMTGDYQPFGKFGEENYSDGKSDGFYYNGGSWLRAEYCAYVVGLKHGWKNAQLLMDNRLWAEIYLNPEWPFSKEFIPTYWTTTASWWPSTRGLCWNVFILMANEVAGTRTPDMDPDYRK